jgi:hypothetical protein
LKGENVIEKKNNVAATSGINFEIPQKTYERYLEKQDTISNSRIRPENELFLDALMSIDMANDPDGRKFIEIIKGL